MDIIISGCNGRMGHALSDIVKASNNCNVVCGFDISENSDHIYPIFTEWNKITTKCDVIIDFSNPSALSNLLEFVISKNIPVVICTTGYDNGQLAAIDSASKLIPIFKSSNMSLAINVLSSLVKKVAAILGNQYDIEIIEKHHSKKIDAPSGTAIMLADSISEGLDNSPTYVYERQSKKQKRQKNEIGISSIRGGNIIGEHDVIFAGERDMLEFKHTAFTRDVFAEGALSAAKWLITNNSPGLYNMDDLVHSVLSSI